MANPGTTLIPRNLFFRDFDFLIALTVAIVPVTVLATRRLSMTHAMLRDEQCHERRRRRVDDDAVLSPVPRVVCYGVILTGER